MGKKKRTHLQIPKEELRKEKDSEKKKKKVPRRGNFGETQKINDL